MPCTGELDQSAVGARMRQGVQFRGVLGGVGGGFYLRLEAGRQKQVRVRVVFLSSRYFPADKVKGLAALCVLLLLAFLLFRDPFLLLWWPQEPARVRENKLLSHSSL